jgi:hypothetical protein
MKHLFVYRYIFMEEEGMKRLFCCYKSLDTKKPLINNGFF